jgi:hypothetical protein
MNSEKLLQYWHPSKGGWHVGEEVERNAKVVTIRPAGNGRKLHVPVEDVKPVERRVA